jgi:hypothetical protein
MAKRAGTEVLDGLLDIVAGATIMTVCSAEPTTRTEAVSTLALADVAMSGGDFSKGAGSPSGRKLTVAAKNAVPIDTSGTGTHVALSDGTKLLYVTTITSQVLTAGGTVNIGSWGVTVPQPS